MKKIYSKPEIAFESFAACTSIAAGCEAKPDTLTNYNSCGLDFSGEIVFAASLNGCRDTKIDDYGDYASICYHVPSDQNNIFNS